MRAFIGVLKLLLLVLGILFTYTFFWIGYALSFVPGLRFFKQRRFMTKALAKLMAFFLNIHVSYEGVPPRSPFFLVSNHLSYIDIVPIFMSMDCRFVAKKAVRNWPILGYMMKTVDVIFADRTRRMDVKHVNEVLWDSMEQQDNIVLFPEGTTTGGDQVLPFQASLLDYPATYQVPVYYAAIRYETSPKDLPARDSVCFFGARDPFPKHLMKMAKNRRVYCKIRFHEEPVVEDDRKALATALHKKVEASLFGEKAAPVS
jgi:1-acyl-sn-glycerol-3-phosphate acyltransferase